MPLKRDFVLFNFERLSRGDGDLGAHEINRRDLFRDRVLHLDPRVHLDEVEVEIPVEQKLDRPGIVVFDGLGDRGCGFAHASPELLCEDQ